MSKQYRKLSITLTQEERKALEKVVRTGSIGAMEIRRANVLLLADTSEGRKRYKDVIIADMLGITNQAVHNIKEKYLASLGNEVKEREGCAPEGIKRKKRESPPVAPKIDGAVEAKITALACSKPPEGFARWTLRLLAEKSVELEIIDSISHTQIQRVLKKTNLSLI